MEEARESCSGRLHQAGERFKERNERQAVLEALPDLVRLDRYERRAWARQKRAIRNFIRIKRYASDVIDENGGSRKGRLIGAQRVSPIKHLTNVGERQSKRLSA